MEEETKQDTLTNTAIDQSLPRYLRIVYPQRRKDVIEKLVGDSNSMENGPVSCVPWFPTFLSLPGNMALAQLKDLFSIDYKHEGLFPMDISSALAVQALNLPSDRSIKVLDLCCSPGAKFLMISELISVNSQVVGVDISDHRLQTCKALVESWQADFAEAEEIPESYLFHCDGTKFGRNEFGSLLFASEVLKSELQLKIHRKRKNKSARKRIADSLKAIQQRIKQSQVVSTEDTSLNQANASSLTLKDFDFILVDAECTHDASYRHMKYVEQGTKWNKSTKSEHSGCKHQHIQKKNKRQRTKKDSTGYFVEEDEEEEEEDFWDQEYSAEDVAKFIQNSDPQTSVCLDGETTVKNVEQVEIIEEREVQKQESEGISLSHNIRDVKVSSEGKVALRELQRGLIENAFNLLKDEGFLVYSTCSQEDEQNEDIVQWLLNKHSNATVDPLSHAYESFAVIKKLEEVQGNDPSDNNIDRFHPICNEEGKVVLLEGKIAGTVRVNYRVGMSGHFIARIKKLK
eukprot:gene3238-3451_t